ncbi:hypothetical protein [Arcticibacter sp.]|uniref:hypothetical protein n=1 Tax=Arcticibacter sp. TaxID=1872630 RepID=UPI00388DBC86
MKRTKIKAGFCFLLSGLLLCSSCRKDGLMQGELGDSGVARVNVVNAVVSGGYAKANVSLKKVYWNTIADYDGLGGSGSLNRLFRVPVGQPMVLQVASLSDTTKLWYDQSAVLGRDEVYSLYLSGIGSHVDTLFHRETNFPAYVVRDAAKPVPSADSIVNIRFVNLSPSGPKVDINIQGMSSNEASGLGYQKFTDFKAYPTKTGTYSIVFEIRRSSDKQLVSTYYFNADYFRFKTVSVLMMGIYDPDLSLPLSYYDSYRIEAVSYE